MVKLVPSREKIVEKILDSIEKGKRLILIYGETGIGKSEVLNEVKKRLEEKGKKVARVGSSLDGIKWALENVKDYDVIIMDDIEIVLQSEFPMDDLMVLELMKKIESEGKVFIASCDEREIKRVYSTFNFDEVIKIEPMKKEEVKEAVKEYLERIGRKLPEDIIERIAEESKGNVKLAILLADSLLTKR